ncbi:hypothetical protein SLG_05710 [Sphingobium sp. SYK-6]|uniref:hypothetical protein n=1 Tax=Sphingobium sp. (strain NBRC 103272 / SYK-6) TaxID=627192 RepID=UPI000227677B|nr:hypothetical protein [Sphingobium sp. SYK-6]BAK65246.1 hypothetical protein SLG_05710 [Sphingobium sp. SYK-6]
MRIAAASKFVVLAGALAVVSGCAKRGDIDPTGQGIIQFRSACPLVAIPAHTGDITVFDPPQSRDAAAVDIVANITNLRSSCTPTGEEIHSQATYLVRALRRDPGPARDVDLPVFSTVVRGGTQVIAKRVTTVRLHFAEGSLRAEANGTAAAYVNRAAATLPSDIEQMITKPRRTGDADAALDPLARPEVRAAIQRSSFELLVGFNLTTDQLRYNITR